MDNLAVPEDLETIKKWMQRFKESEAYYQKFFESGKENYRLYKSYKLAGEKIYTHDIFVPYTFAYVEDCTSYFMLSILAAPQIYAIDPKRSSLPEYLCIEIEKILNWALEDEEAEFVLELEELLKSINIYNIGYLVNYPLLEERKIKRSSSQLALPFISADFSEPEYRTENVFSKFHYNCPHSHDIFSEPGPKRLSRCGWAIKRGREKYEKLEKLSEDNVYNEKVKDVKGAPSGEDPVKQMLSQIGMASQGEEIWDEKSGKVELLDCFEGGDVLTIAGRRAIIQDTTKEEVRPFIFPFPILDARTGGAPQEMIGIGTAESIKPTQKEMNLTRSQRRDNIALLLNKVFLYDMMMGEIKWDTLVSAPGNVIMGTRIHEALKPLEMSDVTASAFKEVEDLRYDLQNITSLWDYARGGTPRRRETATGIVRLQQAAQSRNEWLLRKFDIQVTQPLGLRLVVYLREHLSIEDYRDIVGPENHAEEFFDLDPKQLRRMIYIKPMTESIVSIKEINVNQLLMAYDRLIQLPDVNRPALVTALLRRIGEKDIKKFLPQLSEAGAEATMMTTQEMAEKPPSPLITTA